MKNRKNITVSLCRGGCKKWDFVKYEGKFDFTHHNKCKNHWPKMGRFRCRTCGHLEIRKINPPADCFKNCCQSNDPHGLFDIPVIKEKVEDIKKSSKRNHGLQIRRYVSEGKIYLHEIFTTEDDRVEVITFDDAGEDYVHLLTFTADNYVLLPGDITIGHVHMTDNCWVFDNDAGVTFNAGPLIGVEAHLDAEVLFVKSGVWKELGRG